MDFLHCAIFLDLKSYYHGIMRYFNLKTLQISSNLMMALSLLILIISSCSPHDPGAPDIEQDDLILMRLEYDKIIANGNKTSGSMNAQRIDTAHRDKANKETFMSAEDTVKRVYVQFLFKGTDAGMYSGSGDPVSDSVSMMLQFGSDIFQSNISGGNLQVVVNSVDTEKKRLKGTFNGRLIPLIKIPLGDSIVDLSGSFVVPYKD